MSHSIPGQLLRLLPVSALAMMFLVAGSCEDDPETTQPGAGSGTFRLVLDHAVDGEPLVQNTSIYTTAEGNDYTVNKLVYVLSLVQVDPGDGDPVAGPDVHLRDAFNPDSRTIEITGAPAGGYTGLSFVFGLNEEMNDPSNTYSQPGLEKEWTEMGWNPLWGGGYHYMRLEGQVTPEVEPRDGGGTFPLATHLGRFVDEGGNAFPHFFTVDLPFEQAIDLQDGDVYELQVVMDIDNWYHGPNPVDLDEGMGVAFAIMTNTPTQTMFEENGKDATDGVFSLGTVTEVD